MGVAMDSFDAFATALGIPASFLTLLGTPASCVPENVRGLYGSLVSAVEELLSASHSDAFTEESHLVSGSAAEESG